MSVRPLRLDRVPGPRPNLWHWIFAIVSALLLAAVAAVWIHTDQIHQRLTQAVQLASAKQRARLAPPAPPGRVQVTQIQALNPYIAALNLPWDRVFRAVRPDGDSKVYLLGLDAEPEGGRLRVSATTQEAVAMTDYVAKLTKQPGLADVYLVKHEMPKEGGYRFDVEAKWAP
jgi:Tfp pilus assembly protein PilN